MKKLTALMLIFCCLSVSALAEEERIYTLVDDRGNVITQMNHVPAVGDEYISSDNGSYRVEDINEQNSTARVVFTGKCEMPDVSWFNESSALAVASWGEKKIAMYCTHSDESYVPTDGTESSASNGGIYDVASELSAQLENRGIEVVLDRTTHNPHDAGAYRRSRQTAIKLLKGTPDAIFDIHRDGIPDPDHYALDLDGEELSRIRLLVGKGNQNAASNKAFALQMKAIADKAYPGLVKDIYMGKGAYNQDLYPRSVLLEMGTHTLSKERVLNAAGPMAQVISHALYGGVSGPAGATAQQETAKRSNAGAGRGIGWLVAAVALGGGIFALISTGSIKGSVEKMKRTASEVTGGMIGKKPPK